MSPIKAQVKNGRLVLDQPTNLPEGTEVELVIAEHWDDLHAEDRERLESALAQSEQDVRAGRLTPADRVLDRLPPGS